MTFAVPLPPVAVAVIRVDAERTFALRMEVTAEERSVEPVATKEAVRADETAKVEP